MGVGAGALERHPQPVPALGLIVAQEHSAAPGLGQHDVLVTVAVDVRHRRAAPDDRATEIAEALGRHRQKALPRRRPRVPEKL